LFLYLQTKKKRKYIFERKIFILDELKKIDYLNKINYLNLLEITCVCVCVCVCVCIKYSNV